MTHASSERSACILLVNEEPPVLDALARSLERQPWQLETARTLDQARQILDSKPVSAVVSDNNIRGIGGGEFLRQVKERHPATVRILLAGDGGPRDLEEAVNQAEVFRIVAKPWDEQLLRTTLRLAVEHYFEGEADRRRLASMLEHTGDLESKVQERTAQLARAKQDWELTFDAINRPIAVIEPDFTVARANLAYAEMAERPITRIRGHKCHELLFHKDAQCAQCSLGGDRAPSGIELHEGSRDFTMNSYRAGDRYVCVYHETTEEKLMTRRLLQSEKLAAIGQLAGGVAHEINNPLGAIVAFAQLLQTEAGLSENQQQMLQNIERASHRCSRIVESLLKFSRRTPSGKVQFDLTRAVEDALVLFGTQLKSWPRAVLRQALSAEPLPVVGDPAQIEQVVLNLLVNALQALKDGEGTVTLQTRRSGEWTEVCVQDDGVGILPEHRSRLFEPAFSTKAPGEGTGFGLAICWRIVESHQGTIEVDSEPGKGARFTVRLRPQAECA